MGEITIRIPGALPSDIISISGGTNDIWRYSNWDEEMAADMREDVLEQMEIAIDTIKKGPNGDKTFIILCSTPPILPSIAASLKASDNAIVIRDEIESLAKKKNIIFCDIFTAMADEKGRALKELVGPDGVHFTPEGNHAFGECLGKTMLEIIRENTIQ